MNVAIIPWSDAFCGNRIFDRDNLELNRDNLSVPFIEMKEFFEDNGYSVNTIDLYSDLAEVDWFLFFTFSYEWYFILKKRNLLGRIVYCNAEPETVTLYHSQKGYNFLKKIFPYILTWNTDVIDNETIFLKNIPYVCQKRFKKNDGDKKKLLVNMSNNKFSFDRKELYGERRRVIRYFRDNNPEEFGLYGSGWSKKKYPFYYGKAKDKAEVYHKYKFALSLENTKDVKNYITEKIYDCFCAGIVPIYQGAVNISDFVPADCYIDYTEFKTVRELEQYLLNMPEEQYQKYLDNIEAFVDSNYWDSLSGRIYGECIKRVFDFGEKAFEINSLRMLQLYFWRIKEYMMNVGLRLAKKVHNVIW